MLTVSAGAGPALFGFAVIVNSEIGCYRLGMLIGLVALAVIFEL